MQAWTVELSADFGVFKDPSITTGQMTYSVPSKGTLAGLLAALVGVPRPRKGTPGVVYEKPFMDFLTNLQVGIEPLGPLPERVVLTTNHRSFKADRTYPFKAEFLVKPSFRIYFSSNSHGQAIAQAIHESTPVFTPCLGHAYCLARLSPQSFEEIELKACSSSDIETGTVVVDDIQETDANPPFQVGMAEGELVVERHLHWYFDEKDRKCKSTVLRYYAPFQGKSHVELVGKPQRMSFFQKNGGEPVCMF